jgi:hypothetical protein
MKFLPYFCYFHFLLSQASSVSLQVLNINSYVIVFLTHNRFVILYLWPDVSDDSFETDYMSIASVTEKLFFSSLQPVLDVLVMITHTS